MTTILGGSGADAWLTERLQGIERDAHATAEILQKTVLAADRLDGRMTAAEADILELRNARKRAPEEFRGWMLVVIAVVALAPATLCGLASLAWQVVSTLMLQHH